MENSSPSGQMPTLNRALLALEKMEARLKAVENAQREPIAIIGLGCRFPGGATNAESFWQLLRDGVDTVTEVPPDRWDVDAYYDPDPDAPGKMYTRKAAFLESVDQFDPQFFGIMPKEARDMDPQQRLLLETAWEALENASIAPDSLVGSRTGVFVGILGTDYDNLYMANNGIQDVGPYYGSGVAHSIASGRISYILGLQGPSLSIDTACSSSLVAIHQACLSLRSRETNLALAGGVNLILTPASTIALSKNRMMAADGRCKTFDASADGYVRGEGAGMIVLKRLTDALADGDPILAVIRGTAVNQDGASSGLTVPNGPAQEAVIREALVNAGLQPQDVTYVEMHGTGTSLGDPIEVQALAAALGKGRATDRPVMIGSVKTNVGHLETAAGIAGLVKLIMMLRHKAIPPHLHLKQPSPFIPWAQLPVTVPTELTPWPEGAPLVTGLSSFGFSGTNVHLIITAPPEPKPPKAEAQIDRPSHILSLSARSESALHDLAGRVEAYLNQNAGAVLADVAYTANIGRARFSHRLALRASSSEEAAASLKAFTAGEDAPGLFSGRIPYNKKLRIAFLFTGQGAQYADMGRQLYQTQPVFRAALDECAAILAPFLPHPLLDVMFAAPESDKAVLLDQTAYTQTALFAIEYSLAKLWQSWGVEPFAVMGHSAGEYVAACLAGVFSLQDGLKLIAERGRLMQSLPAGGKMSAIFADEAQVQEAIRPYRDQVSIAAVNGPTNIVISGTGERVDQICAALQEKGIKTRSLKVSHAFHSPLVEPILGDFERTAAGVQYHAPKLRLVSNLTGQLVIPDQAISAAYWRNHIRQPVQFARGIQALMDLNVDVLLEVGPSPTLLGMVQRIPGTDEKLALPTLRQGREDWHQMLESLSRLFIEGVQVDWAGFDRPYARRRLELPTYPFQRQRYWIEPKSRRPSARQGEELHPLLGRKLSSPLKMVQFESSLDRESFTFTRDHKVRGISILPLTGYLEMAQAAASISLGDGEVSLCDVSIHQPLVLNEEDSRVVHFILDREAGEDASFEIYSRIETARDEEWQLHASGRIERQADSFSQKVERSEVIQARCHDEVTSEEHYQKLDQRGFPFGPAMQGVQRLWRRDSEALVEIEAPAEVMDEMADFHLHPALLDACLQCFWATFDPTDRNTYLPMNLERFHLMRSLPRKVWSHIRLREGAPDQSGSVIGDVQITDEAGQVVAELSGLYFRPAAQQLLKAPREWENWLYEVDWQPQPALGSTPVESPLAVSIEGVAGEIEGQFAALMDEYHIERYQAMFSQLEKMSAGFVMSALREMGFDFSLGKRVDVDELMSVLGIVKRYRRLTQRFLNILAEVGVMERSGDHWVVAQPPGVSLPELKAEMQQLLERYPESRGQLTLTGQCGEALAGVLSGRTDPLGLLFPNGSLELAELLYRESPQARIFNNMVRNGIQGLLATLPQDRPLRILEIGAGTGGTTSYVLPVLPPERTQYFFTDISPLFLSRAKDRFAQYSFVHYELLNVENDPEVQGFDLQSFDVVLAVNVLHATADMAATLAHVRQLMKPGGLMVLVEGTHPERWVDVTFGLTDGWWRFTDTDLRANYPLMPRQTWHGLLTASGFKEITALPVAANHFRQAIILARPAAALPGHWLIFEEEQGIAETLAGYLEQRNQTCTLVKAGAAFSQEDHRVTLNPAFPDDFKRLLADVVQHSPYPLRDVVYLWPLTMRRQPGASLEPEEAVGLGGGVYLVQALASSEIQPPRLWLVTRDAQPVAKDGSLAVEEAPLWGLGKVIQLEHPELRCKRIDLDGASLPEAQANALLGELWTADAEDQVTLRGNVRYTARLVRSSLEETGPAPWLDGQMGLQLQSPGNGILEDLAWKLVPLPLPGPGEVAIEVRAAGLNFRDLMNALAMRSDNEALGGECSGIITAVGPGVTQFKAGEPVMGMARGSFGSQAIADARFIARKPVALSYAEAAGLPIAYFTAYSCLNQVAAIKRGQKILIHAAAGGVGMAAVRIALRAGTEVFATAGSDAKRAFLRSMGVHHVFDSRTLDFADEIAILTGGKGVDVVLNSLSGEFIPRSISALAETGIFIEIGKRDIWTPEQFAERKPSAQYHIVDLADQVAREPDRVSLIFLEVMKLVSTGDLAPLPIQPFSYSQAPAAFRHMAQALQTGKIIVTQHAYQLRSNASYLITGGLAGLGLLTAQHLASRGARQLVLVGRSAPSQAAQTAVADLRANGVQVEIVRADISKAAEVQQVLDVIRQKLPPLRGIIHAAGVLDDASLLRQEWGKFQRVMAPKVDGAWFLHSFTLDAPLDFFILYSSTAALLGSSGQSNHSAANSFMDALAHYRRAHGLPALSINWGIWSEIGSAAARKADEWMLSQGVGTISPDQGLEMLDMLFSQDQAQIAVLPIDWATYVSQFKSTPTWLSSLAEEARRKKSSAAARPVPQKTPAQVEKVDFREKLASLPPNQQRQFLLDHIHAQVVKAIGLGSGQEIDPRQPLNELGLDSLMAVELRNMLSSSLKLERNLPATLVFDYPTINALTDYLAHDVLKMPSEKVAPKSTVKADTDLIEGIEGLSDEDVARMLSDLQ